jgi:hypothetical protein
MMVLKHLLFARLTGTVVRAASCASDNPTATLVGSNLDNQQEADVETTRTIDGRAGKC